MEIRRTTQFLSFALGTRSPANPHYHKTKHYTDPNEAKLKFPKDKTPYYDPISKTIKVPGKDTADSKKQGSRKSVTGNKKKAKALKDNTENEEDDEDSIIKPKPVKS